MIPARKSIRPDERQVTKKPCSDGKFICDSCKKEITQNIIYTHEQAFPKEGFCSEECARNHLWAIHASDTHLGII